MLEDLKCPHSILDTIQKSITALTLLELSSEAFRYPFGKDMKKYIIKVRPVALSPEKAGKHIINTLMFLELAEVKVLRDRHSI